MMSNLSPTQLLRSTSQIMQQFVYLLLLSLSPLIVISYSPSLPEELSHLSYLSSSSSTPSSMISSKKSSCIYQAEDGTCYGQQLKQNYFLLDENYTNFNHGSFGTIPRPVVRRQFDYVAEQESYPDRWFRISYYDYIDVARQYIATFINALLQDVVLVENASSAVNSILRSIGLKSGDKVLRLSTAYGMVRETLDWMSETVGIEVIVVDVKFPIESTDKILEDVKAALELHKDIKICVFSHISSMPAVIEPVTELSALAHSYSALSLIDGAHAPGHINVDVAEIGADFYLGNCHKWLYAPKGTAFLWVHPSQQTSISPEPTVISSSGKHDYVGRYSYTGTRDYTGLCTIPSAFEFRTFLGGDKNIYSYCHNLALEAGKILTEAWNTTLLVGPDLTGFMVNIILPSTDPNAVAYMRDTLDTTYNIYIVYDMVPADKSNTGEDIYFTRLSSQVYLEIDDFLKLTTLVPQLLNQAIKK